MKIFISHSSQDKKLALMFTDLLTKGFNINLNDIFCTSLNNSLVVGEDFIKRIKENLHDSQIVFFLITPNYVSSKFCIMEMGAAWAYKENIVPVIVPPLNYGILEDTPMKVIQAIMLDDVESIFYRLYEKLLVEKNIICRLSLFQEHELLKTIQQFVELLKVYVNQNYGFNFKDAKVMAIAQNGDIDAAKIENLDGANKLYCNFEPNKYYPIPSNFISCTYQFVPHKNWATIVPNGTFSFECRTANKSIEKIIVEFKYGDNLFKFYEKTFEIDNVYKKINIPINYDSMPKNYLKDVSEICFVIRPNFVKDQKGQIEIRNLKFQGNEITNE